MRTKLGAAACLAAAALVVTGCSGGNTPSAGESGSAGASAGQPSAGSSQAGGAADGQQGKGKAGSSPTMPQPDLKDVPKVVATVNGTTISKGQFSRVYRSQFQQIAMQAQMSGQKLDQDRLKKQVAENLVGSTLLTQEAQKRSYEPSRGAVDRTLTELAQQNGLKSRKQLMDALTKQGRKKAEIRSLAKEQAEVDHLIAQRSGGFEPSNQELKQAYQQLKGQAQGSKTPSFQKVRPQLQQQVRAQKKGEAAQQVAQQLRKHAKVTINL
ncbi:MAG TPA: SurA N-terminal domain-containing protein [Segeticoccus sp.]|nr:SurA N-terminal domain-containing protein [Segeticoccus sp.]